MIAIFDIRYMDSLFQTLAVENVVGFREPVEMGFDEEIEHFAHNAAVVVRVMGKDHGIDLLGKCWSEQRTTII